MDNSILVVSNEQVTLDILNRELANSGYSLQFENDLTRAAEFSKKGENSDIALLCILPSNVKSMLVLLELLKHKRPDLSCIMLSVMNDADIVSGCLMKCSGGSYAAIHPERNHCCNNRYYSGSQRKEGFNQDSDFGR